MKRSWSALLPTLFATSLAACGDDSGSDNGENGATPDVSRILYSPVDACDDSTVPRPNQLFEQEALEACPLPSDPVEAAIVQLERGEGAEVDTTIELQVDRTVLPESLSSTVTFALDDSGSPSGLPPLVFLRRTVTGTVVTFETVPFVASRSGLKVIRLEPQDDLAFGVEHFVVATRAIVDEAEPAVPLEPSDEVSVVVGNAEPADVGIEEPAAARLLAERGRVSDVLALIASQGQPAIQADDIVSIHSFRTKLGPERLVRLAQRYSDAFLVGRMPTDISITDTPPLSEISPISPDDPDDFDEKVDGILRGTITVPRLLDEGGRLRETWDTDGQTIDVQFVLSQPTGAGPFRVAVMFSGFGRGGTDIIPMAPENANVGTAVMLVDLRCHGTRSPDPLGDCIEERSAAAVESLVDTQPNNGDTRVLVGSGDGIPDDSGRYFMPGDPGQLRDTQLAAAIEILHILSVLRFESDELAEDTFGILDAELGLIAHTQASPVALAALAMFSEYPDNGVPRRSRLRRAMFLGGGVGYRDLILDGPEQIETDFLATAPEGISSDNVNSYVIGLEERILEALDPTVLGPQAATLFERNADSAIYFPRIPDSIPDSARNRLNDTLDPDDYEAANSVSCEQFLFFPCPGDEAIATIQARGPAANFMSGSTF